MSLFAFTCGHVLGPASPEEPYDQDDPDRAFCDGCQEWLHRESFDLQVEDCCRLLKKWHSSSTTEKLSTPGYPCVPFASQHQAAATVGLRGGYDEKMPRHRSEHKGQASKMLGQKQLRRPLHMQVQKKSYHPRVQRNKLDKYVKAREEQKKFRDSTFEEEISSEEEDDYDPPVLDTSHDQQRSTHSDPNSNIIYKPQKNDPKVEYCHDDNKSIDEDYQRRLSGQEGWVLYCRLARFAAEFGYSPRETRITQDSQAALVGLSHDQNRRQWRAQVRWLRQYMGVNRTHYD